MLRTLWNIEKLLFWIPQVARKTSLNPWAGFQLHLLMITFPQCTLYLPWGFGESLNTRVWRWWLENCQWCASCSTKPTLLNFVANVTYASYKVALANKHHNLRTTLEKSSTLIRVEMAKHAQDPVWDQTASPSAHQYLLLEDALKAEPVSQDLKTEWGAPPGKTCFTVAPKQSEG